MFMSISYRQLIGGANVLLLLFGFVVASVADPGARQQSVLTYYADSSRNGNFVVVPT
jgi:hypothetical protein